MSLDLLGDGFDLHGGGQDLAFPHHENERAQAVALGHTFARHWMHNGFVEVDGEKMSKSLGNFTNLLDLIQSTDPRAYRLLVLRSHYRSPVEVTKATADDASAAARAARHVRAPGRRAAGRRAPTPTPLDEFRRLMDDDLNTPGAFSLLFTLVRRRQPGPRRRRRRRRGRPSLATVRQIAEAVGLELSGARHGWATDEAACRTRLGAGRQRDEARAAKEWARADALRDAAGRPWATWSRTPPPAPRSAPPDPHF